jgi:site-specific DNA-cytosine methylase
MKPVCHDLYCGLGGWAEGFLSEGYEVIGYDIEKHDYATGTYPGELILCDVRSIHGSQCKDAAVIVASPPCQAYSYRAMPWKRAKVLPPPDNTLFNECFRIQREASEAAGHYIPLIVENVRGAEKWVGPARWHFGSYYLWGDVPALMPPTLKGSKNSGVGGGSWFAIGAPGQTNVGGNPDGRKIPGFRFDGNGSFQSAAVRGLKSPGTKLSEVGVNVRNAQRFREQAGVKQKNAGSQGWFGKYKPGQQGSRNFSSKSNSRKAASAEIAKIPFVLAQWIAKCFKPIEIECSVHGAAQ